MSLYGSHSGDWHSKTLSLSRCCRVKLQFLVFMGSRYLLAGMLSLDGPFSHPLSTQDKIQEHANFGLLILHNMFEGISASLASLMARSCACPAVGTKCCALKFTTRLYVRHYYPSPPPLVKPADLHE